jgi:hypothetical protein
MPYAGSGGYQVPPPPPRPRRRVSGWWWGLGVGLLVVAAVLVGAGAGIAISFMRSADASFPMQGTHRVELPAHTRRMVIGDGTTESCIGREWHGPRIAFRALGAAHPESLTASDFATFDTGDGHLVFRCFGSATDTVWVLPVPDRGRVVTVVLLTLALPALLGAAGFVVLLVTTLVWFSRRPQPYAGPPASGAPPPPS